MSDAAERPRIKPLKNGPLHVTGLTQFTNSRGEPIATKKVISLCRCGASKNKPFCDGSHRAIGWQDAESDERVPDQLDRYPGKDHVILDNRGVCSHAGYCTDGLPAVWRRGVEPWIDPDGAPADRAQAVIRRCPSGALSYEQGGVVHNSFHETPEIQVSHNGPFRVRGAVELQDVALGEGASREHYALCRCGASRNKPFCDGSHWYVGFRDNEALTIAQANRAAEAEGKVWQAVDEAVEFAADQVHAVTIGEKTVALVKDDTGWHAMDGRCPHQGGPLTEGTLSDGALRCPWHGYDFALGSGQGIGNEFAVETLEVRERDGVIEIAVPAPQRSSWTVSHVMVETLVNWGVDTVFGMVGHSNLGLAEAVRVQEAKGKMRYLGIRHEGAAAFACSGYAKVKGSPAACLSIAGPGATNLLTGLWDAKMDRAPVLALTGQVNTQVMGPGAFQEIDLASAFEAVARFSQTVLPGSNHAELASLALKTAIVERDVAHLIFPDEVQVRDAGEEGPGLPEGRVSPTAITPPAESLENAGYRIARSRRPVIIVGYGAREGIDQVVALAEELNCPVITTFKAKGLIGDDHALGAGVLGRSGTPVASWFMNEADLLIVFGASFSAHTGIACSKPIIQVDFDRMMLGKFHSVAEPVWGDIGTTARLMREGLGDAWSGVDQRPEIAERWRLWRKEKKTREGENQGHGINAAVIFRYLSEHVPDDAIIAVDVGNNTYSFGRYFECKRQSILMSGYLGSIGFGFPAAMGAWAAAPDRKVVSVSGDGGFGQYMGEFLTAVKYGMNITHVLLNNDELGKISKEQRDGEWQVWQTGLHNPSFAEYATLCGGLGIRVEQAEDLPAALDEALAAEGPALVEVVSDPMLT
jgi:thiamine pyrophosphate-dependent acetolactate synthase large subunit-like protein/CDGSH-type Zn-finger protein/nitrite reductase/ring-hydroxylating ferredoxin subunit